MNYVNMENSRFMMHNIKKLIFCFWLCLTHTISLIAQDMDSIAVFTMDKIMARIDSGNIQLMAYHTRKSALEHSAKSATAWMAPMVGLGSFMTPYPGQRIMDERDRGMFMFQAEQAIPNPAKNKAIKRYIESQSLTEDASRAVHLNELKAQAKLHYFNWLVAKKRIKLLKQTSTVMEQMKQVEEIRYEFNQSQLANVFKAEARLNENQNMITMQNGEIMRSRAWLNSLMNIPGNTPFEIDTLFTPAFQPEAAIDTLSLSAVRQDIQKMDKEIQRMRYEVDMMNNEKKPDFKIRFDHMSPVGGMMPQVYSAMAMVSIPIVPWSSKMYKQGTKAMELNISAMQQERAGMLVETQGMVYGMQQEINTMQEKIKNMKTKIVPALKKAFDVNFQAYRENKLQLPAILSDWEALLMMQNTILDDQKKLYEMIVSYEKELFK